MTIVGRRLPGRTVGAHANVHVGIQRRREVIDVLPADADAVTLELIVEAVAGAAGTDFRGRPGERFVYLSWGDVTEGRFEMFSRIKIMLHGKNGPPQSIVDAMAAGEPVRAELDLSTLAGRAVYGQVAAARIGWTRG